MMRLAAQPGLEEETKGCDRSYRINMKRAIGVIRDQFCQILSATKERLRALLNKIAERLVKSACLVRPGRYYQRGIPRRIPPAAPSKPVAQPIV